MCIELDQFKPSLRLGMQRMHLGPHQMPHHRSIMRPHTSKTAGLCKQMKILSQGSINKIAPTVVEYPRSQEMHRRRTKPPLDIVGLIKCMNNIEANGAMEEAMNRIVPVVLKVDVVNTAV
ncbi:hypothetical protein OESDEN_04800 [Oesophagostomum dentatum]|uniref:Uncharacterized protein n=1 Tax=Oesophagostomum dentatum TaxID=61180 RepID=A0A0B1TCI9_OESDE|nr:hypothetical protein OESDEN_04800 [Oesophagostomum dentatum]